ncbi:hypothetical protein niasHS_001255 [Heterodera schachtii]|uniref:Metalloendopeptidase n=1 Tax=Heterodera schachtii TaxID=97005 RepID=A0ABD2KHV6_HETSC
MQNLICLLFSLLFYNLHSAPITLKNSVLLDDESPMDIAALRQSNNLRRLLDRIQITGLNHKGHVTSASENPTKLLQRLRVQNKIGANDGTELSVNRDIAHQLFEGDILLTRPQAQQILREMENEASQTLMRRMRPRQLNPDPNTFWTETTIPFTISGGQNDVLAQSVFAAHRHISSLTCIRFAYYRDANDLVGRRDYMEYSRLSGCWSMVGRQGGSQIVSIGFGCETLGITVHETMHALGVWHEQSRTDQENYVTINYNNILSGTESNFYKRSPDTSDNLGQPYDLGSVMHYSNKAFARDFNQFSITTRDPSYQYTMGYRGGLSFKDAKMINLHYCSKVCPSDLACKNGGYTNPNNCNQCLCPAGYSGAYCDEMPGNANPNCLSTGALMAGEFAGNISTVSLTPNTNCYWKILPEAADRRVMVTIRRLDFPCNRETCSSYVEVKAKQDKVATGARLCCAGVPAAIYADIGAEVLIILSVDDTNQRNHTGFDIEYKSISSLAQFEVPSPSFSNANNANRGTIMPAPKIANNTIWRPNMSNSMNGNNTIRWPNMPSSTGVSRGNWGQIMPNLINPNNATLRGTFVPYSSNANNAIRRPILPNIASSPNNTVQAPFMIAPTISNNLTRGQIQNSTNARNPIRVQIQPTNTVRMPTMVAPIIANNLTPGQIQTFASPNNTVRAPILPTNTVRVPTMVAPPNVHNLTPGQIQSFANANNTVRAPSLPTNDVRVPTMVAPTNAQNLMPVQIHPFTNANNTIPAPNLHNNANHTVGGPIMPNVTNSNNTIREPINTNLSNANNSTRGQIQSPANATNPTQDAILQSFVKNDTVRDAIMYLYSIMQKTPTEQFTKH